MDNSAHTPEYWDKRSKNRKEWETVINLFLNPVTQALIEHLCLTDSSYVLDVATGTGEPGLSIANLLPEGQVAACDISEKMLEIAREKAQNKGITNFRTFCCEAAFLPFTDQTFNAVVCRNGIMFFKNVEAGLKEMRRVLKINGKISVSTWGVMEKNLWISIVLDTISEITHLKSYNRHLPGMFSCMQPGHMSDWFETVDLSDIREEEITGIVEFDSVDDHWRYVTHVSADVVNTLKDVPPEVQDIIQKEVKRKITSHLINNKLYFPWNMRITTGCKRA